MSSSIRYGFPITRVTLLPTLSLASFSPQPCLHLRPLPARHNLKHPVILSPPPPPPLSCDSSNPPPSTPQPDAPDSPPPTPPPSARHPNPVDMPRLPISDSTPPPPIQTRPAGTPLSPTTTSATPINRGTKTLTTINPPTPTTPHTTPVPLRPPTPSPRILWRSLPAPKQNTTTKADCTAIPAMYAFCPVLASVLSEASAMAIIPPPAAWMKKERTSTRMKTCVTRRGGRLRNFEEGKKRWERRAVER